MDGLAKLMSFGCSERFLSQKMKWKSDGGGHSVLTPGLYVHTQVGQNRMERNGTEHRKIEQDKTTEWV